jgi:two-component system NtrC family sensor kinase
MIDDNSGPRVADAAAGRPNYRAMSRTMVRRIVVVSLLPLVVIGGANAYLFYGLNRSIVVERHATALGYHREAIEAFLGNLTAVVASLAEQYSLEELRQPGTLERSFQVIQHRSGIFTDIGIIDENGDHVKYVGPYNLAGRNYRGADWFRRVVASGTHVSDVFLGFRGVPHFVVAVRRSEGPRYWILRATINTDYFSRLVDAARIGKTGETYIVNSAGLYQTRARGAGKLLARADYQDLTPHAGIRVSEGAAGGRRYLYATSWLTAPRWLLIYRQELKEVYSPLGHASVVGAVMFVAGAAAAVLMAMFVARRQVRLMRRADAEKEALTQRLLVTGKTAAVGEMSAGLAHEINNPLAIIDTLQTWIRDLSEGQPVSEDDRIEIVDSARKIGEQVVRCKTITQGLLKFSRRVESQPEQVDVGALLGELAVVERARARVENVQLELDLSPLPPVHAPPANLQQVLVNLVNNAIDAAAGRPDARVTLRARRAGERVHVEVEDNGCGIPEENLSRVFLPFFTTKPVGRGTGLGLAICYGLVHDLGGTIRVESKVGVGTTFIVELPLSAPAPSERQPAEATWHI